MKTWPTLLSADAARARFAEHYQPMPAVEEIETEVALGRVLAADLHSPEDLPPFRRSLMDGYAVQAHDTTAPPAVLIVVGEVRMGETASVVVRPGEAARVPTGGMLPAGADAVVPVEATEPGRPPAGAAAGRRETDARAREWVTVIESITPGRHLIEQGEDVRRGEIVVRAGRRLRPPDLGALLGLGISRVPVTRRPRVGILSTGDELVPPNVVPPPGKVRDMNSYALAASVAALGAVPCRYPVAPDEAGLLQAAAAAALSENDLLILNAGSSVGEKDLVAGVLDRLGPPGVLVHGVNIRPGKPTVFALCGGKPAFGLPGQPVSALNTFDLFVAPVLRALLGLPAESPTVRARLTRGIRSADGREDHVRVALERRDGALWAEPIPGVSAMISTMIRADGITVIAAGAAGFEQGDEVEVRLIASP